MKSVFTKVQAGVFRAIIGLSVVSSSLAHANESAMNLQNQINQSYNPEMDFNLSGMSQVVQQIAATACNKQGLEQYVVEAIKLFAAEEDAKVLLGVFDAVCSNQGTALTNLVQYFSSLPSEEKVRIINLIKSYLFWTQVTEDVSVANMQNGQEFVVTSQNGMGVLRKVSDHSYTFVYSDTSGLHSVEYTK